MKYEELYDVFLSLFTEDIEYFKEREKETGVDVEDGIHVVFGMFVTPF